MVAFVGSVILVQLFKSHFRGKNNVIKLESSDLKTAQELKIEGIGSEIFAYGIPIALLILLLVPVINIVVISMANTNNRTTEIAIRRSMGATIFASTSLLLFENCILVLLGASLGTLIAPHIASLVAENLLSAGNIVSISLISNISIDVFFFKLLPLALLFSLLSGGIPAYIVARGSIAEKLKGGSKC